MDNKFKPKIFAFFLSAGLLLMTVVAVFINPNIFEVIEARAATAGYKAVCIGGCPGAHRGSIPIYAVGGSGSAIGLVTKGYVDNLVLSGGTTFDFTGLLQGSAASGFKMDAGSTTTINGIFTLKAGATIMVGETWQIELPSNAGAFVLTSLATNAVDATNAVTLKSNGIDFEGTADAFEATFTAPDAQIDVTNSTPNETTDLLGVANVSSVQDSHTLDDGATVVAAYTVVDDSFPVGGSIRVTCAGTKTGANNAFEIQLWIDGTERGTLATIATVAGDWVANWILINKDLDTQGLAGTLSLDNDTEVISDFATGDYIDTASADWLLEVFVESKNGSDAVIHEFCVFDRSG